MRDANNNPVFWPWFGGAISAFTTDFIEAGPVGGSVGAIMGARSGDFHADVQPHHLLIEALHLLAVPAVAGLAGLRTYVKLHPLPPLFQPQAVQLTTKTTLTLNPSAAAPLNDAPIVPPPASPIQSASPAKP